MIIGIVVGILGYQTFFEPKLSDNFEAITRSYNESNQYRNHLQDIWAERLIKSADSLVEKGHIEFQNVSDSIRLVRKMTRNMVHFINKTDTSLLLSKGMMDIRTGGLKNLTESSLNKQYFLGDNPSANRGLGNGAAKVLYDSLSYYFKDFEEAINLHRHITSNRVINSFYIPPNTHFAGVAIENRLMLNVLKTNIYNFEENLLFVYGLRLGTVKNRQIPMILCKDFGCGNGDYHNSTQELYRFFMPIRPECFYEKEK